MYSNQKRSGFTLIELLVVIAIIAILAAVLLPVLAKAKEKGMQSVCAANLKQASVAIQLYVNDNEETLPGPVWAGAMASYDTTSGQEFIWFVASDLGQPKPSAQTYTAKVFVCPGYVVKAPDVTSLVGRKVYFLNPNIDQNPSDAAVPPFGTPATTPATQPLKLSGVNRYQAPSSVFAISDVDQALPQLNPGVSWWPDLPNKPVHGPVRNQTFFDGHVEAVNW